MMGRFIVASSAALLGACVVASGPDSSEADDRGYAAGSSPPRTQSAPLPPGGGDPSAPSAAGSVTPAGASSAPGSSAAGSSAGASPPSTGGATIFTVVFENHDYKEIVGSANAPFFNSLIAKYGLATHYSDAGVHPSLPNYLTMISGAPQYNDGNDYTPRESIFPLAVPNLGDQLTRAGIAWRSYQESAGAPCRLTDGTGYAVRHDPFVYFTSTQSNAALCAANVVDYSALAADLASGAYRYLWITPNLVDDGHDPSSTTSQIAQALRASDAWASREIGKIMQSPAYTNGGVIFITWDEAEGRNGDSPDQVPMIVVSERIKSAGYRATTSYSHRSYLATVEDLLGLPRLATVATEPAMLEFLR